LADQSRYILSRLFIAVPELQVDNLLLKALFSQGLVTQAELDTASQVRRKSEKYARLAGQMRGKNLIERIMVVAPEIMSVATINAFRRWGLINETLGNALRVGLRGAKAISAGQVSEATAMERWAALGKSALSFDTINLLRDLDNARIEYLAGTCLLYRRMLQHWLSSLGSPYGAASSCGRSYPPDVSRRKRSMQPGTQTLSGASLLWWGRGSSPIDFSRTLSGLELSPRSATS
jgi:hypothetical protein